MPDLSASVQPALPPNRHGYRVYLPAVGESTFHQLGVDIAHAVHPSFNVTHKDCHTTPQHQVVYGTGSVTLTNRHDILMERSILDNSSCWSQG